MRNFDYIIIGQGLAGTALAWQLLWRGKRLCIIDQPKSPSASRVAAGLITPITGQRLVESWRFVEFFSAAKEFYARVSRETQSQCLRECCMLRVFADSSEQDRFEARQDRLPSSLIRRLEASDQQTVLHQQHGGIEMLQAGQLNVPVYLAASRNHFIRHDAFRAGHVHPGRDVVLCDRGVQVPRLGLSAQTLIFCQGIQSVRNPWFSKVPFDAAKGEILTVRIPGLVESRPIHRGVWIAPSRDEYFHVGATYDREHWDCETTLEGMQSICERLERVLRIPYEVVEHQAAVRPILMGRHPAMGLHPQYPQLGFFNGLASKGALQAPRLAEQLSDHLDGNGPLDPEVDLNLRAELQGCHA